jgi:hypothetical protein
MERETDKETCERVDKVYKRRFLPTEQSNTHKQTIVLLQLQKGGCWGWVRGVALLPAAR